MDIFYTLEWAKLFEKETGGKAEIFKFGDDEEEISFPFIKRRINDLPFALSLKPEYFDITSPYGYGGIFVSETAKKDKNFLVSFEKNWDEYCRRENIISEFIRFHPLDRNQEMFKDVYTVRHANDNVIINLSASEKTILANIDKRHRYSIRRAEKLGVEIFWDEKFTHIADFKRLYDLTMNRDDAAEFYYFSDDFFENLINFFSGAVKLAVAKLDGQIVAGSLFIFNPENVYYFLSGTDKKGLAACANHLLLYWAIIEARNTGKKLFNLGGGLSVGDKLFLFKSGFSKNTAPFYIGTKISNNAIYDKLVDLSGAGKEKNDYFPLYRYNPDKV